MQSLILCNLLKNAALEGAIEALSSGGTIRLPLIRPQLTLLQDHVQPLERYDDYEDDQGELRAESRLVEKFGEFPLPAPAAHIDSLPFRRKPESDYPALVKVSDRLVLARAAADHTAGSITWFHFLRLLVQTNKPPQFQQQEWLGLYEQLIEARRL